MSNLVLEYPFWAILLCPLLGLAFAIGLYYRDKRLADLGSSTRWLLAGLRFVSITVIAFFLLEPLIRYFQTDIEEPVVVVAVDNSSSLILGKDSGEVRTSIEGLVANLPNAFDEKYNVVVYRFGQDVEQDVPLDFTDPVTDISALFESLKDRYANRNLGAVVLASDGIYNRGSNPRYALGGLNVPVYTIALGDTTVKKDALISEVAANRLAFLGNTFPIEMRIRADKYKGVALECSIIQDGKVLDRKTFDVQSDQFEETVRFLIEANEPGLQRFTLRIGPLQDEVTLSNNVASVIVDVIDSRQKVLVLGQSPHPDVFALRRAIESSDNYEVEVAFQDNFKKPIDDFDIVVLHQIPALTSSQSLLQEINASDKPMFSIVGSQTVIKKMPSLGLGVQLSGGSGAFNDARGVLNPSFSKFNINTDINAFIKQAPPLQVPFGNWNISNSAEVILNQRIGSIDTEDPLLLVNEVNGEKNAILLGEGLWRWRLYDYAVNESHNEFDLLITSMIQFLSVKEDKRFFRVNGPRDLMENQPILFKAELYNDSYEAINEPEAILSIIDEEGNTYPFTFTRTETAYRLNTGSLPVGTYSYDASTIRNGKKFTDQGSFSIRPFELEASNLLANHTLLYNISENSGGQLYYPNQLSELSEAINGSQSVQPVSYTTEILSSMLNLGWPLLIILLLLSIEWFVRKRTGHY